MNSTQATSQFTDSDPNWAAFYRRIGDLVPNLVSTDSDTLGYIEMLAKETDFFWSVNFQEAFHDNWGEPARAVEKSMDIWIANVRRALLIEVPVIVLPAWGPSEIAEAESELRDHIAKIDLRRDPSIFANLVEAAKRPAHGGKFS